ncbi:MAG: zf-HC2 domain-containing protein [Acidobacteria bacterium]|nr:zf-HC2 domain-containing protein [Acidobacteriota bacterium]
MTCAHITDHLSEWVDGELATEVAHAVDTHLATCASCQARAHSMRALKHAIARLPSRESPPGAVQARLEALRFQQSRRRANVAAWLMGAGAAVVIGVVALYVKGAAHPPSRQFLEDLVADHLRSVPESMPAEVASDSPVVVSRFFLERVPFQPLAPLMPEARLLGGRLCRLNGERSQLLFYAAEGQTLSLFISRAGSFEAARCDAVRDYYVCGRRSGELTLMLVGALPAETLQRLLSKAVL